jgi:hypothetical protein
VQIPEKKKRPTGWLPDPAKPLANLPRFCRWTQPQNRLKNRFSFVSSNGDFP